MRAIFDIAWRHYSTKSPLSLDRFLIFLQSYVNVECALQETGGEEIYQLWSGLVLRTPSHVGSRVGRPINAYICRLRYDIEFHSNDLPILMQSRDVWRNKLMNVRASMTE